MSASTRLTRLITLVALIAAVAVAGLTAVATRAEAAVVGERLESGGTLQATDELVATNGAYRLLLQDDGNAVVYSAASVPQWSTGTAGAGNRLVLQTDGNAVVYTAANRPLWNSGTGGRGAAYLTMQGDGNLVIYGTDGRPTWSSRTGVIAPPPPPPPPGPSVVGDTLQSGQRLTANQALAVGGWAGVMQSDGNFVVYANGQPQWSTSTGGRPGASLLMQPDGNAVVYSSANQPLWNSGTGDNPGSRMLLQTDGNLVIYKPDGTASWSRTTGIVPLPSDKGWVLRSYAITEDYFNEFDGTARITNTNPGAYTGGFTLTLFSGGRQLGVLNGSAQGVSPGQTVTVDLYSFDPYVPGPYQIAFQTDYSYAS